ncbi:hypothetical protein J6590_032022 [Homalodisca vitripennis]|nr:hypothetical protein J6590_032022 [Homalodisca vitripennis]
MLCAGKYPSCDKATPSFNPEARNGTGYYPNVFPSLISVRPWIYRVFQLFSADSLKLNDKPLTVLSLRFSL